MSKTSGTTGSRRTKARYLTETAVLTALLIVLQAVTKPAGQYVTGACVNAVLAVSALVVGLWSGVTVAVLSPVFAFLLGIGPQVPQARPRPFGGAALRGSCPRRRNSACCTCWW